MAGSLGKKMEEKKKRRGGEWEMVLICFLNARDFSSSLNDKPQKMTGGEKTYSLLSEPRLCTSLTLHVCLSSTFIWGTNRV